MRARARRGFSDVTYIETNKTNPVHFCAGKDPKQPGLLTIKARINRGYGYRVATSAATSWSHNSGADPGALKELWDAVADVEGTVTKGMPAMFGTGEYVYPGEELAIGVSEDAVRSDPKAALQLQPVNGYGFAVGFLANKIAGRVLDQAQGTVAAAVVLAGCADSLKDVRDTGTFVKAANDCVNHLDVRVAVRLAEALQKMPGLKLGARAAAKLAGTIVGLVSVVVEVALPVFTYIADRLLGVEASSLHVFAKPVPKRAKTEVVVLDIYDGSGKVRSKYSVEDYGDTAVDCSQPSQASKGPAVFQCGNVADYLPACWKNLDPSDSGTVLCLRRPWDTTLARVPVLGSGVDPMDGDPVPLAVQLTDGTRWTLRLGGAWGNYGKNTIGWYAPDKAKTADSNVLVKRDREPLFTKTNGTWAVLRGPDVGSNFDARDKAKRIDVARVWFVKGRWE